MKAGEENIPILFKETSMHTLLAMYEYIADGEMDFRLMQLMIEVIDGMLYKGKGRRKRKWNKWGCKGNPHDKRVKKTMEEYPLMRR